MQGNLLLLSSLGLCLGQAFDPRLDPGLETRPTASRNPGFKVAVTKAGLDYVKELSVRLLSRELPRIPMPPELKRDLEGGRGSIRIVTPKIADFRPPKYYDLELTAPNRLKWLMRAIQVRVTGGFDGQINAILPVQMRGLFETRINDMSLDLVAELYSAPTGQPFIKVDVCHAGVHSMDMSISEVGAVQELAFRAFKSTVTARLRPVITTELCRIITEMVNVRANRILLSFPTQIPVTQKIINLVGTNQNKFSDPDSGATADFGPHIPPARFNGDEKPSPSSLILDYRLIDPPSAANQSIVTNHLGEISWFGRGKTPFYPHQMELDSLADNKKMLRVFGSDFVANSLLYHAHHRGIFRFRVNPETVRDFKPLLKTSCPIPSDDPVSDDGSDSANDYYEEYADLETAATLSPKTTPAPVTPLDLGKIDVDNELQKEFGLAKRRRKTLFSRLADGGRIPRISKLKSRKLGPAARSAVLLAGGSRNAPDPVEFNSAARGGRSAAGLPKAPAPLTDYESLDTSEVEDNKPPLPGAQRPVDRLSRRRQVKNRRNLRSRTLRRRNRLIRRNRTRNLRLTRLHRRSKRQLGGFSITHNNEAFLPFCLGDFLPGVEEEFPNQQLELRYKSNAPPTFYFDNGEARIRAHGSLFLSLFPKPKFLFHAFTKVEVDVKLNLTEDNRVTGSAEVSKLELKLTRSRIPNLSQESLNFITDLTKSIINDLTTDIMQQGIPLPTVAGFGLRSPLLSMHRHFAVLETDFEFDESFLAPLIQEAAVKAVSSAG